MADVKLKEPPSVLAPPVLAGCPLNPPKPHPATALNAIIAYKFLKGVCLVLLGLAFLLISAADLRTQLAEIFRQADIGLDSAAEVNRWIAMITSDNLRWLMIGSVLYGSVSWAEGVGLFFRAAWAAWITIGESAMFVPVEVWQLKRGFSISLLVILVLNVGIVWYLYRNRYRLFHTRRP
jgi:uncharacterized membrane protein (DUF2068 family)